MTMEANNNASKRLAIVQRHLSTTASRSVEKVERLTVFGAGLMGAGIAQIGAQNGLKVSVYSRIQGNAPHHPRVFDMLRSLDQVVLSDVTDQALQ